MTQEELLEYNKRCAIFLNAKLEHNQGTGKVTHYILNGESYLDFMLEFHSDWNWIMEVVEAIESLRLGDVKIPATFSSMYQGVRHEIEEYYDASVVFIIEYSNCRVDIVGTMRLRNDFIVIDNLRTKKEAVVQAINQFLIWYNNESKNIN